MTMQFPQSLHAEGWWDHMPAGHSVDVPMNSDELPSSRGVGKTLRSTPRPSTRPTHIYMSEPGVPTGPMINTTPRRFKRSHASAWILVAAVGATGAALAVATAHNPQGMREHLDSTLAKVKDLTGSSSPAATTVAQADAPAVTPAATPAATVAPTPVQDPAPVIAAKSIVADHSAASDTPLPPIAPAAGRSVAPAAPVVHTKQLATLAPSKTKELADDTPQVMPSLTPATPVAPVQPLTVAQAQAQQPLTQAQQPLTQAQQPVAVPPPITQQPLVVPPPITQQSDNVAPPPVQPPASAPQ